MLLQTVAAVWHALQSTHPWPASLLALWLLLQGGPFCLCRAAVPQLPPGLGALPLLYCLLLQVSRWQQMGPQLH